MPEVGFASLPLRISFDLKAFDRSIECKLFPNIYLNVKRETAQTMFTFF